MNLTNYNKNRRSKSYSKNLLKYKSIYAARKTYKDSHSPNASKNRFCCVCQPIHIPTLREELIKWKTQYNNLESKYRIHDDSKK